MGALRRVITAFGVAPYKPEQPLSTRVSYPFRVLAVVALLFLGPWALWDACDNVRTGKASLSYGGRSETVTREQFPRLFWIYTVITGGIGLVLSLVTLSVLYGAITETDERQ
jgi:hypothetical protein